MRIAVVGSGPAGASAGYHLAGAGHEVTLFDRAAFPRDKRCGDWVTPGALQALAGMGFGPDALRSLAGRGAVVRASALVAPNAAISRVDGLSPSCCVPRVVFDEILRQRALAAGCRFVQREIRTVGLPRLWDDFDRIVDARGATAGRANSAGLRAYWTVPRESDDSSSATVQMFADPVYRLGYGWVFPVGLTPEGVRYNVGVGAATAECRARGRSLHAFFDRFVRETPTVQRLAAAAVERTAPVGFPVALAGAGTRVADSGVLRIGDAANLTDPLTGEGIASAITSGMLVARVIGATSDVAGAAAGWQRLYDETFAPEFRVGLRLRRLLTTTPAKNAAVWTLGRLPRLARRFHDVLSGATRYRDLFSPGS